MSVINKFFGVPQQQWEPSAANLFVEDLVLSQHCYVPLSDVANWKFGHSTAGALSMPDLMFAHDDDNSRMVIAVSDDQDRTPIQFTYVSILSKTSYEASVLEALLEHTTVWKGDHAASLISLAKRVMHMDTQIDVGEYVKFRHTAEVNGRDICFYVGQYGDICMAYRDIEHNDTLFGMVISDDNVYVFNWSQDAEDSFIKFVKRGDEPTYTDVGDMLRDYMVRHSVQNTYSETVRLITTAFRNKKELQVFIDLLTL